MESCRNALVLLADRQTDQTDDTHTHTSTLSIFYHDPYSNIQHIWGGKGKGVKGGREGRSFLTHHCFLSAVLHVVSHAVLHVVLHVVYMLFYMLFHILFHTHTCIALYKCCKYGVMKISGNKVELKSQLTQVQVQVVGLWLM